jgi:hypothetical protein
MQAKPIADTSVRGLLSASTKIRFLKPHEEVRYEENIVFRALLGLDVVMDRKGPFSNGIHCRADVMSSDNGRWDLTCER